MRLKKKIFLETFVFNPDKFCIDVIHFVQLVIRVLLSTQVDIPIEKTFGQTDHRTYFAGENSLVCLRIEEKERS